MPQTAWAFRGGYERLDPEVVEWRNGPWLIRAHLAPVDGEIRIVGVDFRSFVEHQGADGAMRREPGPGGLIPFNYDAARQLGRVREINSRVQGWLVAEALAAQAGQRVDHARVMESFSWARRKAERVSGVLGSKVLRDVRDLYIEALARDERRPTRYVAEKLRQRGEVVSDGAVRSRISRARKAGLIPRSDRWG